jgi:NAD(P)-dependent dehydrogenase (short-subunit alcohol dehydrogenase family)
MTDRSGRIAVVTGAGRGIGLEVVRQLAERGCTVVLTARNALAGRTAAERLVASGHDVVAAELDVDDDESAARLARRLESQTGGCDVLVNNAAIHYDTWQRPASADLTVVHEALETNLFGAWRTTQALLPLLRRGAHPRVVNVSSGAGALTGMGAGTPAYAVSKAALNALTLMLAADLRPDGILVNAVCPGWVATDMGGPGGRPVADGARGVVWAATLPDDGPTGGFFRDGEPIPW